ncbi:MAG: hypothetical protein KF802_02625 [Bdellovibrionaceae bacterium]|nr:hypothetical protein [Pseudobdellovibrionaceae bacterium]
MRIQLLLPLIILGLTACSKSGDSSPKPLPPTYAIGAQFNSLVDEFYDQAQLRGITLKRNLVVVEVEKFSADLPANTVGVCFYPSSQRQYPYVEVKKDFWDGVSDEARKNLIYHELGHCLLYRDHISDTQFAPIIGRSVPLSIMYPIILMTLPSDISNFYLNHIVAYISELFDTTQLGVIRGYAQNAGSNGFDPDYIPSMGGYSATTDSGDCLHEENE